MKRTGIRAKDVGANINNDGILMMLFLPLF